MSEALLRMPRLGETMEEGEIADWLVEPGQTFARGEALIEVETDKTMVEYPALGAGTLLERLVAAGERVVVGEPIARVDVGDGPDWTVSEADADVGTDIGRGSGIAAEAEAEAKADAGTGVATVADAEDGVDAVAGAESGSTELDAGAGAGVGADIDTAAQGSWKRSDGGGTATGGPLRATPVARRLARREGLDLNAIVGTGRRGRIERTDVERAIAGGKVRRGAATAIADAPSSRLGAVTVKRGSASESGEVRHAGDVAYLVAGPADGMPFALLHGFAGDHTTFAATTSALARGGRRVVALDLPGHGATRLEAERPEALSAGLAEALAEALDDAAVHLVAHSLGAVPALELVRTARVASLTLLAPVGTGLGIDATFVRAMADPASAGELAHLLRRLSDRPGLLSTAAIETLYRELSRGRLHALADAVLGTGGQTVDIVPALERAARELPVRVLVGHRDRIVDWRDSCTLSPAIAVHHFPTAGHMPHWDDPREVLALLMRTGGGER